MTLTVKSVQPSHEKYLTRCMVGITRLRASHLHDFVIFLDSRDREHDQFYTHTRLLAGLVDETGEFQLYIRL